MVRALIVGIWLILLCGPVSAAWTPIVGIPEPSFGINEVAPAVPDPWTADTTGFYYVAAGGTNSGNGYPANPRGTIPSGVPAGSVIELHGALSFANATKTFTGTAESPIFLRGAAESTLSIKMEVSATSAYLIIENLNMTPTTNGSGLVILGGSHHIAVRNSDIAGLSGSTITYGGIAIGGYVNTVSADNIVIDNVYVHDRGIIELTASGNPDMHCITLGGATSSVWITNSELTRCSGDGVQINAGAGNNDKIHHIYIGNNEIHGNRQAGAHSKQASHVIMSSNNVYDHYMWSTDSAGQGLGMQYGPDYVWFINNLIHDNEVGIYLGSNSEGAGTEVFAVGNSIYNNGPHHLLPTNYGGIYIGGGVNRYIVNNTLSGYDNGVNCQTQIGSVRVIGNIFNSKATDAAYELLFDYYDPESPLIVEIKNNIFHNEFSTPRFKWMSDVYTSVATLEATSTEFSGNAYVSPLFVDASNDNYRIQTTSPAKDTGILSDVYATFQALYGIDISKDIDGTVRPQNSLWDIGAYEFVPPPSYYPFMSASGQVYKRP